jgi:hypothetical protein
MTVARYSGAPAEIAAGVAALVEELVAEGLLVAGEVEAGRAVAPSGHRLARRPSAAVRQADPRKIHRHGPHVV